MLFPLEGQTNGYLKENAAFLSTQLPSTVYTSNILQVAIIWETHVFVTR